MSICTMNRIAESELIINNRGAVYHLNCRPEEVANLVITVGDPDRVKEVSKYFDRLEFTNQHREFVTHTGYIGAKRISCISTGIGPDNIDIVLTELDALLNIDFGTRTIKPNLQSCQIIRVGTSGSLQEDIPVDHFVASTHGLGLDNLLHFYRLDQNDEEKAILQAFNTHTQLASSAITPYISMASGKLLKHFTDGFHSGITVTCPGFFGPQGRAIRTGLSHPALVDSFGKFRFGNHRITNFEMETSAIYGMGKLMAHHCLSLSAIVANRVRRNFSADGNAAVEQLIQKTLEIISSESFG